MPDLSKAIIYVAPDLAMVFRVYGGPQGPGMISLAAMRMLTKTALDALDARATALETRASALETRAGAIEAAATALTARVTAAEARLTAIEARLTAIEARLPLMTTGKATPGLLTIGTKVVTLTVPGVKAGDVLGIQPQTDLPGGLSIAWARCNADTKISLGLSVGIALTANTEITFDILAWHKGS